MKAAQRLLHILSYVCLIAVAGCTSDRPSWESLSTSLQGQVAEFEGRVGYYVEDLEQGKTIAHDADSLFPTASLIKVPIMLALFDRIERGELSYTDDVTFHDSLRYSRSDLIGKLESGSQVSLSKLVMLMITTSDNTASLWLQELAGGGTAINAFLDAHGYPYTRVNSRTAGREADRAIFGWGQTTPREMATMLKEIREATLLGPAASEEMYRVLTRIFWNDEALSVLPPWIQAASKQGAVSDSRSEAVLVNGPEGDYVFALITDGQTDTSWESDNAGYVLLRDFSRALYEWFAPNHPWSPSLAGREAFAGP